MKKEINLGNPLLNLILTPKEYNRIETEYETPYILDLTDGSQRIIYFGSEHSNDPSHPQYDQIEKLFSDMVETCGKPDSVIVGEGFIPTSENSRNEMIKKYGESGLLSYLAHKNKMKIKSLSVPSKKIIEEVLHKRRFEKFDVASWMFLNMLWGTLSGMGKDDKEIKQILENIKKLFSITDTKRLGNRLYKLTNEPIFSKPLENISLKSLDKKKIQELHSPFSDDGVLNKIGREINNTGDKIAVCILLDLLQKKKNVFAVSGANHVVAQEPAIKEFFKTKRETS